MDDAARESVERTKTSGLFEWTLGPRCATSCNACKRIAAQSPYTMSTGTNPLPASPGDDASRCRFGLECDCSTSPEAKSWDFAMEPIRRQCEADAKEEAKKYR
jgi:hypothetical protein